MTGGPPDSITRSSADDLETVITDLLGGQYKNPVRVVSFSSADGWGVTSQRKIADETNGWSSRSASRPSNEELNPASLRKLTQSPNEKAKVAHRTALQQRAHHARQFPMQSSEQASHLPARDCQLV
jgi:hypothetical protein